MNITVKKDGEDITFLYSTENINTRTGLVFHNWTNEKYNSADEPFVFIGGQAIDSAYPERMEKYKLQAEGIIKKKLDIIDVVEEIVSTPVAEEEAVAEEASIEELVDETDEDLKKKTQD
jgi:hypothetical protein